MKQTWQGYGGLPIGEKDHWKLYGRGFEFVTMVTEKEISMKPEG